MRKGRESEKSARKENNNEYNTKYRSFRYLYHSYAVIDHQRDSIYIFGKKCTSKRGKFVLILWFDDRFFYNTNGRAAVDYRLFSTSLTLMLLGDSLLEDWSGVTTKPIVKKCNWRILPPPINSHQANFILYIKKWSGR